MHKSEVTRLTKKFQTTIPREIRLKKGLEPGDIVEWVLNDDGTITLRKVQAERLLSHDQDFVRRCFPSLVCLP
ncbi:MAG: AbrB/MazE/SpoVT family DNA-binding domain-containing protein [Bacillota bacterium]